ncbi:hypothetical protein BJ322DRAFT_1072251 [Thelephora terrestris]|uniref:Uncharacterized protein n=1 Tax=Thelephora terrestris TaxID=56493 RepID=A0A9P6L581_9AGAM|nr:hypothetical protein BJ322DRAFT_1072251 [Thelephora terrestris]
MFDPQASDEPPPPAYELTQETFDQKTQQGIQASLQSDPLENLWEEWDEAKFEANSRTPEDSSSSSSAPSLPPVTAHQYPKEKGPRPPSPPPPPQEEPAVRPLRIVKKSQTAAYQKAVEASSYQSDNFAGGPAASSDGGASLSRSFSVLSVGRRTPPPMFEAVGPSYDGPQYDEVVMSYVPGNSRPSSPMSVLSAESYQPPALPPQPQMVNSRPNTNMGMRPPPPPLPTQYRGGPRPAPAPAQRPQYRQPGRRVGFDPMSAYKSKSAFTPGLDSTPERVDPSAFYNSAVSAHLSTVPQRSAITPAYRPNGVYQQELQHPRPHHAATFNNFTGMGNAGGMNADMNMGRERPMSVMSTDSSYYPNPPVNLAPNRGWGAFNPNR